jgi:hypothetical protein
MGAGDETAVVNFTAGTRHLRLTRDGQVTKLGPTGHQTSYLTRAVLMPADFLDAVVQTGGFNLIDASAVLGPRGGARTFTAADLTRALANLKQSCTQATAPQPAPVSQQSTSR